MSRVRSRQIPLFVGLLAVALAVASCGLPDTGPRLVVELFNANSELMPPGAPTVEPSNDAGDPDACCCRVIGRIRSQSSITVHAKIKFEAFQDGVADSVGTAIEFFDDLTTGEERSMSAPGFLRPCTSFDRVELTEVDLRGIFAGE